MSTFPPSQTLFISLIMFIIMIVIIRFKLVSFNSKTKNSLPPSPRKLPIIGNLHQLGSRPHRSLQALSRKHGPLILLHLGSVPTLLASSAEAAKEIMKTHDLSFSSRPNFVIPSILFYGCRDIGFSPYGQEWRQLKSIVVINLLSSRQVKNYQHVRKEEIDLTIGTLTRSCGSVVNLSAMIISLTNNIICKVAFGRTYHGSKFTDLLRKHIDMIGVFNVGSYIPWLSWVDRLSGLEGRATKVAKEFDEFLEHVIEEHVLKKRGKEAKSNDARDFVDILLDVQRDETIGYTLNRDTLKAVILDVFAAGTDTIFTILEWTFSELIKHPKVMKQLQQEVTQIAQGRSIIPEEDLEKMLYLKAVIKESFRLYAPAPLLIPRMSTQHVKLMGYDIPKNTQVLINAWAIGRDPTFWEGPEEFKPERFLENSIDLNGLHFNLIPFGSGRRGCPGIPFSIAVMEFALANIVYKIDFSLPNGVKNEDLDMTDVYGMTVHRKSPLMVMASPRF